MNDILMIGPQGSGKGSQSRMLAAETGMPHVSIGTLLRNEVHDGTDFGKEIKSYTDRGDRVPTPIVHELLTKRLAEKDAEEGVILDGFPRTLGQADELDYILSQLGRRVGHVVYLNVSDQEAQRRLAGRLVCTNKSCERNYHLEFLPPKNPGICDVCGSKLAPRSDDTPDAIQRRLAAYHSDTKPLIALYSGRGLLREINGERKIDAVHADILKAVGRG